MNPLAPYTLFSSWERSLSIFLLEVLAVFCSSAAACKMVSWTVDPSSLKKYVGSASGRGEALQGSGERCSVDKQLQAGEPLGGRREGSLDARAGARLLVCAETVEVGTELEELLRLEGRLGNQLNAGRKEEDRA